MPLTAREIPSCPECDNRGRRIQMFQLPFVAMCDHGHLQDFPWREWVHRSARPECAKSMRLYAVGGTSLAAQVIKCDCGEKRSLGGITETQGGPDGTVLSNSLDASRTPFLCTGQMPWLGTTTNHGCSRPLRGSLRNASNVYFPQVRSAIYLPREAAGAPDELVEMLQNPPISTLLNLLGASGQEASPETLRGMYPQHFGPYTDQDIRQALKALNNGETQNEIDQGETVDDTAFRRAEYNVLRIARDAVALKTKPLDIEEFEPWMKNFFDAVVLVEKLRETRVFTGFSRIYPTPPFSKDEMRRMLWRKLPKPLWLPAYQVFGEGILILFNEKKLAEWEQDETVIDRMKRMNTAYRAVSARRRLEEREISARFVLLHTFAHLIMNRMTFESGYSSAALRERLYVSTDRPTMAGVLIYTAAGDAEGTMGGLVRLGKPGFLESVIRAALEGARWCSADPVCMEMGSQAGQGPDSCNLAACHNCSLVPETACEEFNRFLDRGVVIGTSDGTVPAYFDDFQ